MHEVGRCLDVEIAHRARSRRIVVDEAAQRGHTRAVDEDVDGAARGIECGEQAGRRAPLRQVARSKPDPYVEFGRDRRRSLMQALGIAGNQE